jgi:hypothetical protein
VAEADAREADEDADADADEMALDTLLPRLLATLLAALLAPLATRSGLLKSGFGREETILTSCTFLSLNRQRSSLVFRAAAKDASPSGSLECGVGADTRKVGTSVANN